MGIGNALAILKTNHLALLLIECPEYFSGGWKKGEPPEHLVVIKDEKVCLFVKFEIMSPLLYCLLDLLTNKHRRTWCSDKFVVRTHDLSKVKNPAVSKAKV